MAAIDLAGDTLGQKHHNYKNLVRSATADDNFKLSKLNYSESTTESSQYKINSILGVLVFSARDNFQNIQTLLEYYQSKHMGELYENKVQFHKVLSPRSLNKFNERIWSILDDIFTSVDFYADTNNDVPKCFEVMIVYKLTHDVQIPETFNTKVHFNSFIDYRSKLNADEQQKVLDYVFETCFTKLYKKDIVNEEEMSVMVDLVTGVLVLLKSGIKAETTIP
ncbi:unnamed protein product [Diatraea saccharalis]|uniref:Uncharacterized protein n=1 Tax=Diatraea saccharalis TaxID=40085 RepID=A0A9N9R801_9NEOP|nr:unnamed protein product [Diatraea saccharalis]